MWSLGLRGEYPVQCCEGKGVLEPKWIFVVKVALDIRKKNFILGLDA